MSSPTPCCASPTCLSFRSPKYQPLARKACLTAVTGKQSPCFGYYSQRRDLLMLHRAPKPLLLKPACALKAGEEAIQLNRVLRVGEDRAAEKRKRWNRRRGSGVGQSALKFGISVGEEGEGVEQHVEESGGAIVGDGGEKIEDLADEGGVSVVFPSSTKQKETVSLPLRERTSAPPS